MLGVLYSFYLGEVKEPKLFAKLLVKKKVLWWPVLQTKTDSDNVSASLLNKNRTKVPVGWENVKPFTVEHSQMEGMSREWRNAAVKIVKR